MSPEPPDVRLRHVWHFLRITLDVASKVKQLRPLDAPSKTLPLVAPLQNAAAFLDAASRDYLSAMESALVPRTACRVCGSFEDPHAQYHVAHADIHAIERWRSSLTPDPTSGLGTSAGSFTHLLIKAARKAESATGRAFDSLRKIWSTPDYREVQESRRWFDRADTAGDGATRRERASRGQTSRDAHRILWNHLAESDPFGIDPLANARRQKAIHESVAGHLEIIERGLVTMTHGAFERELGLIWDGVCIELNALSIPQHRNAASTGDAEALPAVPRTGAAPPAPGRHDFEGTPLEGLELPEKQRSLVDYLLQQPGRTGDVDEMYAFFYPDHLRPQVPMKGLIHRTNGSLGGKGVISTKEGRIRLEW